MTNDVKATEPAVLYKYLTAERAVKALPENGNGALRATPPAALNDPLECATRCSAVYPSDDREVSVMIEALNSIVPEHGLTSSEVQLSRRQLGTQAWNELLRKQLSLRFGVVSFSESALHPLLWAHYADSSAGVVIGYRVSTLKEIIRGFEQLGAVKYFKEPPFTLGHKFFKNESNLHAVLLTKASYWEYEQEWRLTLELRNTVGTGTIDGAKYSVNICPIPNEAVTKVYYTERTPNAMVKAIKARLGNRNNRFTADAPRKLILASDRYGYEEEDYL